LGEHAGSAALKRGPQVSAAVADAIHHEVTCGPVGIRGLQGLHAGKVGPCAVSSQVGISHPAASRLQVASKVRAAIVAPKQVHDAALLAASPRQAAFAPAPAQPQRLLNSVHDGLDRDLHHHLQHHGLEGVLQALRQRFTGVLAVFKGAVEAVRQAPFDVTGEVFPGAFGFIGGLDGGLTHRQGRGERGLFGHGRGGFAAGFCQGAVFLRHFWE